MKFSRKREPRIFDMQHPPMSRERGTAGRVEKQRAHEQGVAGASHAWTFQFLRAQFLDTFGGETAQTVRPRQHAQSAVGFIRIVEVKPHDQHLFEKFNGRLNMRDALFDAPRAKAGNMGALAKRQRQVLVPRHQPVAFRIFIEINAADGNWL